MQSGSWWEAAAATPPKLACAGALPAAAMCGVLTWAVPGVEGRTTLQTWRLHEAGGAGPVLWGMAA